jgi:pimeloyl-ACP methyl ester carboxylesterase
MKRVLLLPGFGASDLAVAATRDKLWWDVSVAAFAGLGGLRLAPDGVSPQPPDGVQIGVSLAPQDPWGLIRTGLQFQLDPTVWQVDPVAVYDWRLDIIANGTAVAAQIMEFIQPDEPVTLVGHSEGGLVACVAWSVLGPLGGQNRVRRIISIGTPFQGSYAPIAWFNGTSSTIQQLLAMYPFVYALSPTDAIKWTAVFLNGIAATWPAFYELFPALQGDSQIDDPFRPLLYTATNYNPNLRLSQPWLDYSKNVWQPLISGPSCHPPGYVMTCVACDSLATFTKLRTGFIPLDLLDVSLEPNGDNIVTSDSATRNNAANVIVTGDHSSLPLGITINGTLAKLILDPRGPIDPTPPVQKLLVAIPENSTDPPTSDPVSGLVCLGGG